MAAGTVTITEELLGNVKKITFAWVAGTAGEAGTASGTTTYPYSGNLLKAVTVPGTGGDAPDDNYNVTLKDEDGIDVANGQLLLRDQTNTEWVTSSLGAVVGDKLTFAVAAAGSANTGTCIAYIGLTPDAAVDVDAENALFGTAGITTFPVAAVPADNVSIAEVLRSIWAALEGTAAGENGIVTWPAAAAAGNGVSIAEVVRYIQATQLGTLANTGGTATLGGILGDVANSSLAAQLGNLGARMVSKEITYAAGVSYPAFTVTGLVAVKVVGYVTTALTNHADTTSVGTATSAAGLIAATAGTAMQTTGQAWVDNAPSKFETFPANWTLIGDGEDIAVASTANIAGGVVTLYCWYIPISSGSAVVAA